MDDRPPSNGVAIETDTASFLPIDVEGETLVFDAMEELVDVKDAIVTYDAEEAAKRQEQLEREQAELNMVKAVLGSVFSVRRPRDVVAGTSSGLKTMARGVGLGLASLVAQPYLGAKHGGAKGFVKGVGAGVATCAVSTVGGVLVGSGQVVRGLAHTPEAIIHRGKGKVWNRESRTWEKDWYSLPEEAKEVLGGSSADFDTEGDDTMGGTSGGATSSTSRPRKRVAERKLYDVLGVEPEASESQIRRAFYKKSLQYHPDKNPDNPDATAKFQAVSEAYRVLGDEDRRRTYDDLGQDSALAGMPKVEPMVFFAALFGSHHFELYVGRLRLAVEVDGDLQSLLRDAVASTEDEEMIEFDALKVQRARERMKVVQHEREVKCAVKLVEILSPVVVAKDSEKQQASSTWEVARRQDAERLAQVPSGLELLYLIGWVYANRARQFFAGGYVKRALAKVEGKIHMTKSKYSMAGTVGRTAMRVNGVVKKCEKNRKSLEAKKPSPTTEEEEAKTKGCTKELSPADEPPTEAETGCGPPQQHQPPNSTQESTAPDELDGVSNLSPEVDEHAELPSGQDTSELKAGSLIMVTGLQSAPELNEEVGVVLQHDAEKDRYLVQLLTDSAGVKSLKRENILLLEAPADADGFSGSNPNGVGNLRGSDPKAGTSSDEAKQDQWGFAGDDAEMANAFKDCMPLFHDSLWSATTFDIETTLSRVVDKVLRDMSVDKAARRKRAEVLLRLGLIFQEPMEEHRKKMKAEKATRDAPTLDKKESEKSKAERDSTNTTSSSSGKRSILARFRPSRLTWRSKTETKDAQKEKAADDKRKRMEGALAMMAAGANTDDVDDMIAARTAMEAEFGEDSPFL